MVMIPAITRTTVSSARLFPACVERFVTPRPPIPTFFLDHGIASFQDLCRPVPRDVTTGSSTGSSVDLTRLFYERDKRPVYEKWGRFGYRQRAKQIQKDGGKS